MAKKLFVNILVLLTFFNLKSYAQNPTNQISASSSKNYETQAIKNNNQIEIRLIPKNTPPQKVDKPQEAISENFVNEESSSKTTKKDPEDSALQDSELDEDMVYKKSTGEDDFNESNLEKINKSNKTNIEKWREEQRKQREERIKKRNLEAKQKFQQIKSRSIIKEAEEIRLKNMQNQQNNNQKTSSPAISYSYNPSSPSTNPSSSNTSQQNQSNSSSTNPSTNEKPQTSPSIPTNPSNAGIPQTSPSIPTNSESTPRSTNR
ncbi:MAG: hypothetical protein EBT63_03170 [Proteobacteria bacterium]|nr:hypothetical protein [Pseudomonadota bacterium]